MNSHTVVLLHAIWAILCGTSGIAYSQKIEGELFVATGRSEERAFNNIESLTAEPDIRAGFVRYVELSSIPMRLPGNIQTLLNQNYKPGKHADGPLTPVTKALVLFDQARNPTHLLGLYEDSRVTVTRLIEVDSNCVQGDRKAEHGCTISNDALSSELKAVFDKNAMPQIDIKSWRSAGNKSTSKAQTQKSGENNASK